jgi:hypothetical protein
MLAKGKRVENSHVASSYVVPARLLYGQSWWMVVLFGYRRVWMNALKIN